MQLLLIIALLLYGGRGDGGKFLKEFRPVLETFGGEEIKSALKNADELQQVISAFSGADNQNNAEYASTNASESQNRTSGEGQDNSSLNSAADGMRSATDEWREESNGRNEHGAEGENSVRTEGGPSEDFPLAPVAGIADKEILYRLVRFFSEKSNAV